MAKKTDDQKPEEQKFEMEYRMMGGTGLKVSVMGYGTMTFDNEDNAIELLEVCRKYGVNFFDNAELYGQPMGNAEILFGKALKKLQKKDPLLWRRSDLVITTKLFFFDGTLKQKNGPTVKYAKNEIGLSRKHLMEGIKGSLERLQLDYVDIVYAHRYDSVTPMEEIVRGFTDIIRSGKAFYWGTSMWPAQKLTEAYWIARLNNLIPPVVEQPIYNMFSRDIVELEYPPLYEQPYGLGTTIWSPLDSGILTGKYNDEIPTDSRLSDKNRLSGWFKLYYEKTKEEKTEVVKALMAYAKEKFNSTVTILALAWTIKNRNVSVCILGGTKPQQLEENMKAIELASKLTKQHLEDIDKILENKPTIDPLRIPLNRLPEKKN